MKDDDEKGNDKEDDVEETTTTTTQVKMPQNASKLASLATLLERAVVRDLADELANEDAECSVDYDQEVFEECTNRVTEQLAEVVVLCNSADIASKYSSNLRNKELSRLRGALWNLRVLLESYCATAWMFVERGDIDLSRWRPVAMEVLRWLVTERARSDRYSEFTGGYGTGSKIVRGSYERWR